MSKTKIYSIGIVLVLLQISVSGDECNADEKKCQCVYPDGTGFTLDGIVKSDSYLQAVSGKGDFIFFYHPCGDGKDLPTYPLKNGTTNVCKENGYSLCAYNNVTEEWTLLGKNSDLSFVTMSHEPHTLDLVFEVKPGTGEHKKSTISLTCTTPQSSESYLYAPIEDIKLSELHLKLFSNSGCSKQIEEQSSHFFYYFFMILFIALFLYLAIGMAVNYIFVGARGYELIPNYDFWCKTRTMMQLGFAYVKNGCRVLPSEDSYDAI